MKSDQLGIEHLSVFGLPPVDFVTLVADLGCRYLATGLSAVPFNPHGYAPFNLRDDAALRREMMAAMRDRGIAISLGEGFTIRPDADIARCADDLDIMAELGVLRINTVSLDPDFQRTCDQFAVLAELAAARGMETTVELSPGLTVGDLDTALAAIRHVGRRDFRLLLDTMHVFRSGAAVADIAALDPHLIGYVQLCDAPWQPAMEHYMEEAMFHRLPPGQGQLPLGDLLALVPNDCVIGLEVPMSARAQAGVGPRERLEPCVAAARLLLDGLETAR